MTTTPPNNDLLLPTVTITITQSGDGYAATLDLGIDVSTLGSGQSGCPPQGPGGPPPARHTGTRRSPDAQSVKAFAGSGTSPC